MTYKLAFNESALKEWKKLGHTIQEQFKKKLRERLRKCSLSRQTIRQTGSVLLCDGTLTYATYMKLWPTLCM